MKLLLDQGLPRSAAALLRRTGIDTVHVGEVGYAEAEDHTILHRAREEGRVVVTLDADFHALLAISGAQKPSVVRPRVEGLRADALATLLQEVLHTSQADLEVGAKVTVHPTRIRIRRLPIAS
jgi:predicted nuclease of predicted toxin-antitoxin system